MKRIKAPLRKMTKKRKVLIFFLFFMIIAIIVDCQMRPLIKSIAATHAQIISTNAINESVINEISDLSIDYSEIIKLERDDNGKIIAINTDMKKVNQLKAAVSIAVQEKITNMGTRKISIPIGTLTGTEIFNGRGPKVPMKISMSGSIIADFRSDFASAGINQTKHQIYMDISTNVFVVIPGYPVKTAVKTSVLIAETVIVGDTPSVFANLS